MEKEFQQKEKEEKCLITEGSLASESIKNRLASLPRALDSVRQPATVELEFHKMQARQSRIDRART